MIAPLRHAWDLAGHVEFHRARELLLAQAEPLPPEMVALEEGAQRIIARSYRAQADLIPYARSAMDGFAVRAIDTLRAGDVPVLLPVTGTLYAGDTPSRLAPEHAIAIATGAPLPLGADAVVPIERVVRHGDVIVLHAPLIVGQHVFPAGDDAKAGDLLSLPGDPVTPGRAALLAAAGYASVLVHRRPRVSVVCTGDEVVPADEEPGAGQVRNSNAAMLATHLARDGAELVSSTHVSDAVRPLQMALRDAVAASDFVITTGGASVGERDLVKNTLGALGMRFAFRSVALRPAKPTAFGRCANALVAVLPGNPAAAFVAYATLMRGVVRRLAGHGDAFQAPIPALLNGSIRAKAERHFVLFGQLTFEDGSFSIVPLGNQCSSLVRTSADANALIVVPPGSLELPAGTPVSVEVLDWNAVQFR